MSIYEVWNYFQFSLVEHEVISFIRIYKDSR